MQLTQQQIDALQGIQGAYDPNTESSASYFQDPTTKNVYSQIAATENSPADYQLITSGDVYKNPFLQTLTWGNRTDPIAAQKLYDLQQSNPSQFYNQVANDLANEYATGSKQNWVGYGDVFAHEQDLLNQIENLKNVDPKAYYTGKLSLLSQLSGWDVGQNTPERSAARIQEIKSLIPEAQKAGLSASDIQALTQGKLSQAAQENAQRIANEKAAGGGSVAMDMLTKGLPFVGAFALGAYGLDAALAGGLAADAAAGAELAGPTYGELGYTGLAEGAAGPTYAELGYTGLNNQEAIALADAAAKQGISVQDAYKAYSRTKQIASLLNGGGGSKTATNPQAIAAALQSTQTPLEQFGGLYRMNEKPFLQQKTASLSPDSYNVSGQDITSPTTPTNKLLADLLYKEV